MKKISIESWTKINHISALLRQAQGIFDEISNEDKSVIFEHHNESYPLPYCLKWGNQAVNEISDDFRPSDKEIEAHEMHGLEISCNPDYDEPDICDD